MATQGGTAQGGLLGGIDTMTPLHWLGVLLALITGVLHFGLTALLGLSPLGISFLVAGVGFLGGAAAVIADYRRKQVYILGIPFTLGQIVFWLVANWPNFSPPGYVDKIVQVAFVAVLVTLYQRS